MRIHQGRLKGVAGCRLLFSHNARTLLECKKANTDDPRYDWVTAMAGSYSGQRVVASATEQMLLMADQGFETALPCKFSRQNALACCHFCLNLYSSYVMRGTLHQVLHIMSHASKAKVDDHANNVQTILEYQLLLSVYVYLSAIQYRSCNSKYLSCTSKEQTWTPEQLDLWTTVAVQHFH